MSMPTGSLRGPGADVAKAIIETALTMTHEQAVRLSRAYDADPNANYLAHCAIIQDALAMTGRSLTVGWFEAAFRYQSWTRDTRALHAIADVVMATLVADVVAAEVTDALTRPWKAAAPFVAIMSLVSGVSTV